MNTYLQDTGHFQGLLNSQRVHAIILTYREHKILFYTVECTSQTKNPKSACQFAVKFGLRLLIQVY